MAPIYDESGSYDTMAMIEALREEARLRMQGLTGDREKTRAQQEELAESRNNDSGGIGSMLLSGLGGYLGGGNVADAATAAGGASEDYFKDLDAENKAKQERLTGDVRFNEQLVNDQAGLFQSLTGSEVNHAAQNERDLKLGNLVGSPAYEQKRGDDLTDAAAQESGRYDAKLDFERRRKAEGLADETGTPLLDAAEADEIRRNAGLAPTGKPMHPTIAGKLTDSANLRERGEESELRQAKYEESLDNLRANGFDWIPGAPKNKENAKSFSEFMRGYVRFKPATEELVTILDKGSQMTSKDRERASALLGTITPAIATMRGAGKALTGSEIGAYIRQTLPDLMDSQVGSIKGAVFNRFMLGKSAAGQLREALKTMHDETINLGELASMRPSARSAGSAARKAEMAELRKQLNIGAPE